MDATTIVRDSRFLFVLLTLTMIVIKHFVGVWSRRFYEHGGRHTLEEQGSEVASG